MAVIGNIAAGARDMYSRRIESWGRTKMKQMEQPHGYRGGYLIGFMMIAVVALRAILFYQGQSSLLVVLVLIVLYAILYSLEPWLTRYIPRHQIFYFPLQTALVIVLSNLRPFLDFHTILYFPLCIQAFRIFSRRAAIQWTMIFAILLGITLLSNMDLFEGLALFLLNAATGVFLISSDFLYLRMQSEQRQSQRLLEDLQSAHQKLQEQAAQMEELAAARERNRLARELHDSVSQVIFSITLTSRATRILLERDPTRVPTQIEHLKGMTSNALNQLRSLIAELRPHESQKT
jgi:signal transduction histidine kinase